MTEKQRIVTEHQAIFNDSRLEGVKSEKESLFKPKDSIVMVKVNLFSKT